MSLQKEVAYFPVYKNTHSLKGWLSSIFKAMDYCITKGLSKCHCMKESRLVLAEAVLGGPGQVALAFRSAAFEVPSQKPKASP